MKRRRSPALIVACACLVLVATPAQAYIDPGTGSLALQVLIGALAALSLGLRSQWSRVKALFGRSRREPSAPGSSSTEQ